MKLATGTQQKVLEIVKYCEVNLNGFSTKVNLKILPLGSYDILINMDSLEQYHVMLDCFQKSILCIDSQGNQVKIPGIPKNFFVRHMSTVQAKKCIRKGCKLFAMNIQDIEAEREQHIKDFPVLVDFMDVFLEEILGLPLTRDLEYSIELMLGTQTIVAGVD